MSAFSIKEFYAPYVVCLYLYDFGCEIIFASNNAEKITPLFAKEIITKSSMSDVFYFDDIGQELETTLKEIKKYAENAQIAILIVLGTNTIESELKQLTQTLYGGISINNFKKEFLWEEEKRKIINKYQEKSLELVEFHILDEEFLHDTHGVKPEYVAHVLFSALPKRIMGDLINLKNSISLSLLNSSVLVMSKQAMLTYLEQHTETDHKDRLTLDFDKNEISLLAIQKGRICGIMQMPFFLDCAILEISKNLGIADTEFQTWASLFKIGLLDEGKVLRIKNMVKRTIEAPLYKILKAGKDLSISQYIIDSEISVTTCYDSYGVLIADSVKELIIEYYQLLKKPQTSFISRKKMLFDVFLDTRVLDSLVVFYYLKSRQNINEVVKR